MDQVKFVEKCLFVPQILLGPFLNTLVTHNVLDMAIFFGNCKMFLNRYFLVLLFFTFANKFYGNYCYTGLVPEALF